MKHFLHSACLLRSAFEVQDVFISVPEECSKGKNCNSDRERVERGKKKKKKTVKGGRVCVCMWCFQLHIF